MFMNSLSKCYDCGKCCLETEMLLSKKDINLILERSSIYYRDIEFTKKTKEGNFQLKNMNGHCVFFDAVLKVCKIYEIRPQGCRFYPMIYEINNEKCIIDKDCPRYKLFYQDQNEFESNCKALNRFIKDELKVIK